MFSFTESLENSNSLNEENYSLINLFPPRTVKADKLSNFVKLSKMTILSIFPSRFVLSFLLLQFPQIRHYFKAALKLRL